MTGIIFIPVGVRGKIYNEHELRMESLAHATPLAADSANRRKRTSGAEKRRPSVELTAKS
jgi:hypothetical protein